MNPTVVWFNKYLSNTWEVLEILRATCKPGEFFVLCTHPRSRYPGQRFCDIFAQEPDGLSDDAYIDWCLDFGVRHKVSLFMPGRKLWPIANARERFAQQGIQVLGAADAVTLKLLNHKGKVYAALPEDRVNIPAYEVVTDLAGFDEAWARLRPHHSLLCYKPATSVYGLGFHIVADRGAALDGLRAGNPVFVSLDDARRKLGAKSPFRPLLVMQYLPGPERSVDCLARSGELLQAVVRRKEEGGQVLEDNPDLVATVRRITERFRLSNLFNVQFRDAGGKTYLLEINPRMSGGLPFACRSGFAFPTWALRVASGSCARDWPPPQTGLWVPQPEPVSSL